MSCRVAALMELLLEGKLPAPLHSATPRRIMKQSYRHFRNASILENPQQFFYNSNEENMQKR